MTTVPSSSATPCCTKGRGTTSPVSPPSIHVQQHEEFKLALQVVKYTWNREYAHVWRILKSDTWGTERAAFLQAVLSALREVVATSITAAYSVMRIENACETLGMSLEELKTGVNDVVFFPHFNLNRTSATVIGPVLQSR